MPIRRVFSLKIYKNTEALEYMYVTYFPKTYSEINRRGSQQECDDTQDPTR